jgi:hypothetical protein
MISEEVYLLTNVLMPVPAMVTLIAMEMLMVAMWKCSWKILVEANTTKSALRL